MSLHSPGTYQYDFKRRAMRCGRKQKLIDGYNLHVYKIICEHFRPLVPGVSPLLQAHRTGLQGKTLLWAAGACQRPDNDIQ